MCNRPSTTLSRVLASVAKLGPNARAHVRNLLGTAPTPPSLQDALRAARGPQPTRDERLATALRAGQSEIGAAPSTRRAATVAFKGGK